MRRNNSLLNVESILPEENSGNSMSSRTSPNIFHRRKLFSADNSFDVFSSGSSSSNPRNNSFDSSPLELIWHSRFTSFGKPKSSQQSPNYYQQLLIQEEEDRKRRELERFLYETPPKYAAPPVPSSKTNFESEIKSPTTATEELVRFLDSPTRTESGKTLAKEFKFVYGYRENSEDRKKPEENGILNGVPQFETKIEMTDETQENSQIVAQKSAVKNCGGFSLSIDENYLKDNSQISPISVSTTDSLSPRSSSEPPKRRLAARRRITKNLNCSESESDIMVENEDNENVESESSTFCSPSASHSNFETENVDNLSFDTLTTVALDSTEDYVIMGKGKFFGSKKEKDIQSRPLPPTPSISFEEPEDIAPETVYSTIDEEKCSTETVFHQRSVSDQVLNPKKNNFDDDKIRKTNSDRTERRSAKMVENDEEMVNKLSNTGKETRNLSCSTPIINNGEETGKRKRSETTDSVTTPENVGCDEIRRPRLTTSSGEGTLKLRDPSFLNNEHKRFSEIQNSHENHSNLNIPSNEKLNNVSNHSITSLMDKFMSKRHISEPQIKMNQNSNLSPKDAPVRRSFKKFFMKNFISGSKSTTENLDKKKCQELKKSGYSTSFIEGTSTVKLRTSNLKEETQKLTTLTEKKLEEEENDVDGDEVFFHISKPPTILRKSMERPWRGFWTKSFYGNLPKNSSENINQEENLKRRVSVIGDVECDRKIYAPSQKSNEKLDKILKEQFGEIPKIEVDDSFICSSDDEITMGNLNLSERNINLRKSSRKRSIQTEKSYKTLPRKTGQGFKSPTKMTQKIEDGFKSLPRGRVQKKRTRRGQALQKRKSINYTLAAVSMMENDDESQKLTKQTVSAVILPGKSVTPNRRNVKRFISSSAVSDINKPILKSERERKGTLNFLTRIGAGRKKSRDARDLDLYGQMTTSPGPKSASLTFPFHGRQANSSVLPDTLKFLNDAEKAATVGGYLQRSSSFGSIPNIPVLCLEKPKWEDLHLWDDESGSWQQKWQNLKLSDIEKKRQNVIFELYQTEKNHCQTLVFFQQAYQVGLKGSNILDDNQLSTIIPDVLDSLLDFHLDFLRKMKERMAENPVVEKISDILLEVFKNGQHKKSALNGYKNFCISKDECCQNYTTLMEKNQKFRKFVEKFESDPEFKKRNFKSCFLLIAQRLTKYGVLIDQIFKLDVQGEKERTRQAWIAVDDFVRHIDTEMKKDSLNKQWEGMRKMLELTSKGKMLGREFSYDDLTHQFVDNPRKVVLIGKCVLIESHINLIPFVIKQELSLILFDDILVFFFMKGSKMYFFHHNHFNCVIPIKMMLAREVERTTNIRIIVTGTRYPEMYLLQFATATEIKKWVHEIQQTQVKAPEIVRRAPGQKADELLSKEDLAYNKQLETWEEQLKELFDGFLQNEDEFPKYMNSRMALMDNLRELYKKFPCNRILLGKDASSFSAKQDLKHIERIQKEVSKKFRELKDYRRKKLESLVELATKSRDSDLTSFFDDLYEVHLPSASSSGESAKESSSNESQDETGGIVRDNKPRRVKTYHGTTDTEIRTSIRRHTTLPKMKSLSITNDSFDEELEEDMEIQNEIQKRLSELPLLMPQISRDAATKLIDENVKLRVENNKLKSTIAMQESHISSLKSRKAPIVENAVTHESLRQKEKELQLLQKKLQDEQDNFRLKIQSEKERLATREDELKKRESDLEARIKRGSTDNFRSGAFVFHDNMIENQPKLKPKSTSTSGILALAAKSEIKRKR